MHCEYKIIQSTQYANTLNNYIIILFLFVILKKCDGTLH